MNGLTDLDELVSACRSEDGRRYIAEAVRCYQVGAYRSCIVTTWLAVVFDFVAKLRELDALGVDKARNKLVLLTSWRHAKDIKNLLIFEQSIPAMAELDYNFISAADMHVLERLKEDRNLCAHPTIGADEEPFDPNPETARCHLKNAVDLLLRHPAALSTPGFDRIFDSIESDSFPTEITAAKAFLSSRLFIRPTDRLIRKMVTALTAVLLKEQQPQGYRFRAFAALGAICELHPFQANSAFEHAVREKIHEIADSDFDRVYSLCRYRPETWGMLTDETRIKAEQLLHADISEYRRGRLEEAATVPALEKISNELLKKLDQEELESLFSFTEQPDDAKKVAEIVSAFVTSASFAGALTNAKALVRVADRLSLVQLRSALAAYRTNDQIWYSWNINGQMHKLLLASIEHAEETREDWLAIYEALGPPDGDAVKMLMRDKLETIYPEFLIPRIPEVAEVPEDFLE